MKIGRELHGCLKSDRFTTIRWVSLSLKKEEKYTKMIFDTLLEKQSIEINNAKQRLKTHSNFHNSEKIIHLQAFIIYKKEKIGDTISLWKPSRESQTAGLLVSD